MDMNFGMRAENRKLLARVADMVRNDVMPLEEEYEKEVNTGDRWQFTERQSEILEGLKNKAKSQGLWNFWLTNSDKGFGLSTVEYAYFAEEMGRTPLGAEVFNCSAPDTGNMEVFERYGTEAMKQEWLAPLLDGQIRSAYLMTEPDVASSDATNISMSCVRDGDHYVLNGEKWWSSGAGDPRCKVYIVMVKTGTDDMPKHQRHSMIVVPAGAQGIEVLRPMLVYGADDAPHGHMHIRFTNVRVPAENLLLGEGRGFEISQGRLGPGRIHHCMRAIGQAESALELMCKRSLEREAFGKPLAQLGANFDIIAECRMEIEQAPAVLESGMVYGSGRCPGCGAVDLDDQNRRPADGAEGHRRGCADVWGARHQPRYALGQQMDPCAHLALGRWARRRAPPPNRAGRAEKIHPDETVTCLSGDMQKGGASAPLFCA